MRLPPIKGIPTVNEFFIYAACDEKYFDEFGKSLINSINANSKNQIHIHLFNPRQDQLDFCQERVSFTYETVNESDFVPAIEVWDHPPPENSPERLKYDTIINAARKNKDDSIAQRIRKTYFACVRFIRLYEMLEKNNLKCLAIDVDAIVRKSIPDFYLDEALKMFRIEGPKARFLAGAIYFPGNDISLKFLKKYSQILIDSIQRDYLYWSLDQTVLDEIMEDIKFSPISKSLIDWDMRNDSIIWTAKGSRKESDIFKREKLKYS